MVVNVNSQRIASVIRQVGAIGAVVVGVLQSSGVIPGNYGWVLTGAGAVLLSLEHYVSDPSTGTTPPPPAAPADPSARASLP